MPTVGLNIENIVHGDYEFTLWDVGGSKQAARHWKHYFDTIDGVLFVVDITDQDRLKQAKETMWRINDPAMAGVPFLVFLNKTDKPNKMDKEFVMEQLEIEGYKLMRPVRVQECSALDGSGIMVGVNQMIEMIENN